MSKLSTLAGLLFAGSISWACGDKLSLIMGARSSQIKPLHPAVILAYPGRSASAALIRSLESQPAFKKAGYKFQLAESSAAFDNALKEGKYDVVLADIADANGLSQEISSAASKAILLPVAFKASKDEQSAAQKKYHCLLKAPSNFESYVYAIDRAMDLKLKGAR